MLSKILNLPSLKTVKRVDGELMGKFTKKKKFFRYLVEVKFMISVLYDHVTQTWFGLWNIIYIPSCQKFYNLGWYANSADRRICLWCKRKVNSGNIMIKK
jgi:hypothetical protein